VTLAALVCGAIGLAWGLVADRLATRWPAHDDEVPAGRSPGWRTAVTAGLGGLALGSLPGRFGGDPLAIALFGGFFLALVVLLATDLDQRLIPDVVSLPLIPIALAFAVSGRNPLVGSGLWPAVAAAIAIPAILYLLSIPFGAGAFGLGDVKLLASVGLAAGLYRTAVGLLSGLLLAGVVIVALLLTRRIGLRDYIPFGPFLIVGAFWAVLSPG
jgi:leader peptidase (prepilin peptidase)/N-methyltransferase